ncbi:MAG: hypothetical protein NVS3B26_15030 [Mycobacteriales bacterium]
MVFAARAGSEEPVSYGGIHGKGQNAVCLTDSARRQPGATQVSEPFTDPQRSDCGQSQLTESDLSAVELTIENAAFQQTPVRLGRGRSQPSGMLAQPACRPRPQRLAPTGGGVVPDAAQLVELHGVEVAGGVRLHRVRPGRRDESAARRSIPGLPPAGGKLP